LVVKTAFLTTFGNVSYNMHKAEDTRHHPDMPKRATPAKGILEAPSLKPKRTRSWPVGAEITWYGTTSTVVVFYDVTWSVVNFKIYSLK
jgi:hypothetical protein